MEYFDKEGVSHFVKARVVVLAASACDTAKILLNSRDGGLANSSGEVGRNLLDTTGTNVSAHIPALENHPRYNEDGMDVAHVYIPFWLYQEQAAGKLDFPRGYHYEIGGRFFLGAGDRELGVVDLLGEVGQFVLRRGARRRRVGQRAAISRINCWLAAKCAAHAARTRLCR